MVVAWLYAYYIDQLAMDVVTMVKLTCKRGHPHSLGHLVCIKASKT